MKQMLDVLLYLLEHHMHESCQLQLDENSLFDELEKIGFADDAINEALDWLDGLDYCQRDTYLQQSNKQAIRLYTIEERFKIDTNCRDFLLFLERVGILNSMTRELVIDRLLVFPQEQINIATLKWVILMVLFNQPDKKDALACMEHLVLKESQDLTRWSH